MAFRLKKSGERNDEADLKIGRGKRKKRESGYLLLCLETVIFAYSVVFVTELQNASLFIDIPIIKTTI